MNTPESIRRTRVAVILATLAVSLLVSARANALDWKALAQKGSGEVVTLLEVGGGDEYDEGDATFVQPGAICVAADHSFFVVDGDGFVVHFSRDGEALARFGRKGEGPGELMDPLVAALDPQGRLLVYETGNRRFSFLQPDGTFIKSMPYQDFVERLAFTRDGALMVLATGDAWMPEPHSTTRLARYAADLSAPVFLDSLSVRKFQIIAVSKENQTVVSTPYYAEMDFCMLADGSIAYGRGDRYEIRIVGPDLEPRATLRRDIAPRVLTDQDRDEYVSSFENNGEEFMARVRSGVAFPKYVPLNFRLFADGPFLIVVRDGPVLDVFDGETFLGEVSVPDFRVPRVIDGDRYYRPRYSGQQLPSVLVYSVR
ncbi:MAG TPA: hypothetical protein VFX92_03180 [Candidatus Krumholzibacteria bacterium]|nr:hypothetical protein [Candidatus Krumholzibacteria bacterium]